MIQISTLFRSFCEYFSKQLRCTEVYMACETRCTLAGPKEVVQRNVAQVVKMFGANFWRHKFFLTKRHFLGLVSALPSRGTTQ
eukprot:g1030.t1